jgi:hypothetical protein
MRHRVHPASGKLVIPPCNGRVARPTGAMRWMRHPIMVPCCLLLQGLLGVRPAPVKDCPRSSGCGRFLPIYILLVVCFLFDESDYWLCVGPLPPAGAPPGCCPLGYGRERDGG